MPDEDEKEDDGPDHWKPMLVALGVLTVVALGVAAAQVFLYGV